uniref:Putative ovule protein n=1 Tax=Solanum chacoense TaxID=4108 RepID=A0A0V0HCI7_SOLCH
MLLNQYNSVQSELRHRFYFECVDGFDPDLVRYLGKRIDETMDFDESWFPDWSTGLTVPEEVKEIKENTGYLTEKQMWKIQRVEAMEAYRRRCRRETARFRRPKFGKDKLYYRT